VLNKPFGSESNSPHRIGYYELVTFDNKENLGAKGGISQKELRNRSGGGDKGCADMCQSRIIIRGSTAQTSFGEKRGSKKRKDSSSAVSSEAEIVPKSLKCEGQKNHPMSGRISHSQGGLKLSKGEGLPPPLREGKLQKIHLQS